MLLGTDFKWKAFFDEMNTDGNGTFALNEFTAASLALATKHRGASTDADAGNAGGDEDVFFDAEQNKEEALASPAPSAADQEERWEAAVKAAEADTTAVSQKLAAVTEQLASAESAAEASKLALAAVEEKLSSAESAAEEAKTAHAAADERLTSAAGDAEAMAAAIAAAEGLAAKFKDELAANVAEFESYKEALSGEASETASVLSAELATVTSQRDSAIEQLKAAAASLNDAEEASAKAVESLEAQISESTVELENAQSANKGLRDVLATERKSRESAEEDSTEEVRVLQAECASLRAKQQQLDVLKARLETQLSQEKENHAATKEALSASTSEGSKSSMLDLELADYKRTADSLQAKVKELEEEIEAERTRVKDAEESAKELEGQLEKHGSLKTKDEEQRTKLKALLLKAKKELTDKRATIKAGKELEEKLAAQLEEKTQEVETIKTELTSVTVALDMAETAVRESSTSSELAMRTMHVDLENTKQELAAAAAAASEIEAEFKSYKVRAHTILKQKDEPKQAAADNDPEMVALGKKVEELTQQVADLTADLETSTTASNEAEAENEEMAAKLDVAAKESARLTAATKLQVAQMQEAQDLLEEEHARVTRQIKMDHAMLVRSQKDELETVSKEFTGKLKKQDEELDGMRATIRELTAANATGAAVSATSASGAAAGAALETSSDRGSATLNLPKPPAFPDSMGPQVDTQQTALVSDLGHLLSAPGGSRRSTSSGSSAGPAAAVGTASAAALAAAEKKVGHLTELLEDSENMIDRLQQQSQVLKKEIRRQESLVARADGANLEYLKNVVLKFITAVDEREQLIPVFGMLLHFTQEELKDATQKHKVLAAKQQQLEDANSGSLNTSWFGSLV